MILGKGAQMPRHNEIGQSISIYRLSGDLDTNNFSNSKALRTYRGHISPLFEIWI